MFSFSSKLATIVVVLAISFIAASCGDGSGDGEAQPAEDAPVFVDGDVGRVPVHPLAEAVSDRSTKDDVVAQSFEVRNVSREQLFDWYADNLEGWRQVEEPAPIADGPDAAWRGTWTKGDRHLLVTASEAPTLSEDSSERGPLQYSLSLEPA